MEEIDQEVVPDIVPQEEPLTAQVTEETETLSLAVPEIETVEFVVEYVEAEVGEVMETVGAVVSVVCPPLAENS